MKDLKKVKRTVNNIKKDFRKIFRQKEIKQEFLNKIKGTIDYLEFEKGRAKQIGYKISNYKIIIKGWDKMEVEQTIIPPQPIETVTVNDPCHEGGVSKKKFEEALHSPA